MINKRVQLVIMIVVIAALISGIAIWNCIPIKIISDAENVSISRVFYYGEEIYVDEAELISILSKYYAKRTFKGYLPYDPVKIEIEIDIIDKNKTKHFLLGEFNIWYESSDMGIHKILNELQLKDELNNILK